MGNIIELTTEMEEVEAFPCRKAKNDSHTQERSTPKHYNRRLKSCLTLIFGNMPKTLTLR